MFPLEMPPGSKGEGEQGARSQLASAVETVWGD